MIDRPEIEIIKVNNTDIIRTSDETPLKPFDN